MKTPVNLNGQNLPSTLNYIITQSKEAIQTTTFFMYAFRDETGNWYCFNDGLGYDLPLNGTAAGNGVTFWGNRLQFTWPSIDTQLGAENSKVEITCFPCSEGQWTQWALNFFETFQQGLFDGQPFWIYQAFICNGILSGYVTAFMGFTGEIKVMRSKLVVTVNSLMHFFNIRVPKNMYQPGCSHALYDPGCALNKASYAFAGAVPYVNPSLPLQAIATQFAASTAGYFSLGTITFTSGLNYGLTRTIKFDGGGYFMLMSPLPNVPEVGASFTAYPGCDKVYSTCVNKFSNSSHYRGFKDLPLETIMF